MSRRGAGWPPLWPPVAIVTDVVRLRAPAKLTVSLKVIGVRPDGYHLIDAEMVSLDLADVVTISEGDGLSITGPFAGGVPSDDSNLVRRALALVRRQANVVVDKRIPPGGGLGGGSTDAAAVLRWAGFTDCAAAARLGADIPFCLIGGRARVTGIGEVIESLPHIDRQFTLVAPPFGCPTPAVYHAWDELGGPTGESANDLEVAALAVEPRLAEWRDRIATTCGQPPVLAGSGSTWFVAGAHPSLAKALPDAAAVVVTRTEAAPGSPPRPLGANFAVFRRDSRPDVGGAETRTDRSSQ
jgi:4-diphosphocytidyl-2-C-methyl-D-erythritol kinase